MIKKDGELFPGIEDANESAEEQIKRALGDPSFAKYLASQLTEELQELRETVCKELDKVWSKENDASDFVMAMVKLFQPEKIKADRPESGGRIIDENVGSGGEFSDG